MSNTERLSSVGTMPASEKGGSYTLQQKILIIDDDVDLCELLAESLRRQGILVVAGAPLFFPTQKPKMPLLTNTASCSPVTLAG